MTPRIRTKRAYEAPSRTDGFRVLVDRVWPRGVSKDDLQADMWAKDVAPSTKLRTWFGHDPERWVEFQKRYRAELRESPAQERLDDIIANAGTRSNITLLYGAKDTEHNQAVVLKAALERLISRK